jgi:hypothetical protein
MEIQKIKKIRKWFLSKYIKKSEVKNQKEVKKE